MFRLHAEAPHENTTLYVHFSRGLVRTFHLGHPCCCRQGLDCELVISGCRSVTRGSPSERQEPTRTGFQAFTLVPQMVPWVRAPSMVALRVSSSLPSVDLFHQRDRKRVKPFRKGWCKVGASIWHPFCFLGFFLEQDTSKSAKSSMKNSNNAAKDSAAESSEEVSPPHAGLHRPRP